MSADDAAHTVRAFVALELDDAVRAALARLQSRLKRCGAQVGWVPPANFHVSLAFLGDLDAVRLAQMQATLWHYAADVTSFAIHVSGVGCFGSRQAPRVVWAGVAAEPLLMEAQRRVAAAARASGIALESRPYRPHVTLGRVRSGRGREGLRAALLKEAESELGTLAATRLVLMRSLLTATGAHYEVVEAVPFRPPMAAGSGVRDG